MVDDPTGPDEPEETPEAAGSGDPSHVVGRELLVEFAERRWRVRGLDKVTSFDVLRVNLLLTVKPELDPFGDQSPNRSGHLPDQPAAGLGFHVDTLDLYSARARAAFVAAAAEFAAAARRGPRASSPRRSGRRGASAMSR